jgi:hypothetical protein
VPSGFADPANTFHEKAMAPRRGNTCYFASVNYACRGSATTSADHPADVDAPAAW